MRSSPESSSSSTQMAAVSTDRAAEHRARYVYAIASSRCRWRPAPTLMCTRQPACCRTALNYSAQQNSACLAFGIVHHAALIVEDHGLAASRIRRRPGQTWLTEISSPGKVGPGCGHLLRQRLCLRSFACAQFARIPPCTFPNAAILREVDDGRQ